MLTISKIYQFFYYEGNSNFSLSGLSSEVKGNINRILAPNSNGTTISNWRPTGGSFQTLLSLVPGNAYLIESKSTGFSSYELPIDTDFEKNQDDSIAKIYYSFTYQGCSNFSLSGLSSEVKGNINRILAPNSNGTTISNWRPTGGSFQTLLSLVPGNTYLIESKSTGFVPYSLGIPPKCAPPSSSSSSVVASSSSSSSPVEDSSSSSEDCSAGLPLSLKTVLDAEPELAGFWYGEDEANGFVALSVEELEFRYGIYNSYGLPFGANLMIDGTSVATVMFAPAYINTPFAVVYRGVVYCGLLLDEQITLGSATNILTTVSGDSLTDQSGDLIRAVQND